MRYSFIIGIVALLLLAACGECSKDTDCASRTAFSAACVDSKCTYTPIPDVCGNNRCDGNENKCTCPQDCGRCEGKVAGTQYLGEKCDGDTCVEDVIVPTKPIYSAADIGVAGDKFKLETEYQSPFNIRKDTFITTLTLTSAANDNIRIKSLELTGLTSDRRTILLGTKQVNKPIWTPGQAILEQLPLDFPTGDLEGELTNLQLSIVYDYVITQGGKETLREATMKHRYMDRFIFVKPSVTYACPASCDDNNPATRDSCGPETNFFCRHEPIPNTCGNFVCDARENKCTCPQDCGPCQGDIGQFLTLSCKSAQCVPILKSDVPVEENSIFDDRSLGPIQLNNNYNFNNPFNVKEDAFELLFSVYRIDPLITDFKITTIRLLEGQQQIAELQFNQNVGKTPVMASLTIPSLAQPEETRQVALAVWYSYKQSGNDRQGNYQKPLGKIVFLNP